MQKLSFDGVEAKLAERQQTKTTSTEWQNRACEMLEFLQCPAAKKSEVFRLVKTRRDKAEATFRYMQERGIKSVFYFFKVMSI